MISAGFRDSAEPTGFTSSPIIDLRLNQEDLRILGNAEGDNTGQAVFFCDLNGDDQSDIIIGAPLSSYPGRDKCGIVYILLSSDTLSAPVCLGSQRTDLKRIIGPDDPDTICDALALHSGLPKGRIKKAINCGAVWLHRSDAKSKRIRRATTHVQPGDRVSLYYDESILSQVPPRARCIRDLKAYSVWFKPANLMTQGTRFGDHGALIRQVERYFTPRRKIFLVHRLDRETSGLVIIAHDRRCAALLSEMFRSRKVQKTYQAWVLGNLGSMKSEGTIDLQLDTRRAVTHYALKQFDAQKNQSLVQITPVTGRRHQIRRHFDMIGHPVMGDPRYGRGNKNKSGLQLTAVGLAFECPLGKGSIKMMINRTDVK